MNYILFSVIKIHLIIQLPNVSRRTRRSSRPVTETTIEEVRCLIDGDPHLTIDEIQVETGMSHGTIERIISEYLQLRKITARWMPNILTDAQRIERVRLCEENLAKFHQGTWRLYDVVKGEESWFYHKQISNGALDTNWRKSTYCSST